jgi:hypothetical protein
VLINQVTTITTLTATAEWYSQKDLPVVVDPTMPTS